MMTFEIFLTKKHN